VEAEGSGTCEFQIREMTAAQRDAYLDRIMKRTKMVNGQAAGLNSFDGVQAELLTVTLFHVGGDQDGIAVSKEEVQGWPSNFVSDVFRRAQELNGLSKADAALGNA